LDGLCVGGCTPGEFRCNGSTRQTCNATGTGWTDESTCALGCAQTVCIENEINNQGNNITLSGKHVYQGCVALSFNGSINVPANMTLEIWAKCLTMASGTSVSLGSGSSFRFHASETIDTAGSLSGGNEIWLSAWKTLVNNATIQSSNVILRADMLTNGASGQVAGTAAALHGVSFTNNGSFSGTVSVMPPEQLSSVTNPDAGWWNFAPEGIDISWDKPFPGVIGYYTQVGSSVPGPGNGTLTVPEHVTIAPDRLRPGANKIRVVAVNSNSLVGTYPIDLDVNVNMKPPVVTSMSHPKEGEWTSTPDVFFSWTDPVGPPPGTFIGYRYVFDKQADTIPTAQNGTSTKNQQVLFLGQAPGIYFFHIVGIDRLGRPSPLAAHYEVRIGTAPQNGNIAGHIDAGGMPLSGVHVLLNGGLFHAYTASNGDYTFYGEVPASLFSYDVRAVLPGYAPKTATVNVMAGSTTVQNFTLDTGSTPGYRLGWEFPLAAQTVYSPSFALGSRGKLAWANIDAKPGPEKVTFATTTGDVLGSVTTYPEYYSWMQPTDIRWNGSNYEVIDTYACSDQGTFQPGQGWSCLGMQTYDVRGTALAPLIRYATSGQSGSASGIWNGSTYGTFFVAYTSLYFREITSGMQFVDGMGPTNNMMLAGPYSELRQSAFTNAQWDGGGYGVLYQFNNCYFARYGKSGNVLVNPVSLGSCATSSLLGLVWDGQTYHAAYSKNGMSNTIELRSISQAGVLGTPVSIDLGTAYAQPSIAYDRRNLLVAYAPNGKNAVLEIRSPVDYSLKQSIDLGPVIYPRVDFNPKTGEAAVVYVTPGGGTNVRMLYMD